MPDPTEVYLAAVLREMRERRALERAALAARTPLHHRLRVAALAVARILRTGA